MVAKLLSKSGAERRADSISAIPTKMKTLKLKGKSSHGKNRIKEHGQAWKIIPVTWMIPPKGKIFIQSQLTGDMRWIKEIDDINFEIIEVLTEVVA